MIGKKLIPALEQKFGQGSFSMGRDSKIIASFPPAHPEVGELKIFDDGNEVIIEIGEITHGHFCRMNAVATNEEAEEEVVANVVDFLEDLFAGKYILWRTRQRGAGGWKHVDFLSEDKILSKFENDAVYFNWSGPLPLDNESGNL